MLQLARYVQHGDTDVLELPARHSAAEGLRHKYAFAIPRCSRGPPTAGPALGRPLLGPGSEILRRQTPGRRAGASTTLAFVVSDHHGPPADSRIGNTPCRRRCASRHLIRQPPAAARGCPAPTGAPEPGHFARGYNVCLSGASHGNWADFLPRQTGRMYRQSDDRTDFYLPGIGLYRQFTEPLPFQSDDPLEWLHCHISNMPVPLHQRVQDLWLQVLRRADLIETQSQRIFLTS